MNVQKIALLSPIHRREFMQVSAGSLALAAAACRRAKDRAYLRGNTLIVAIEKADSPLLLDDWAGGCLVFLPLVRENELNGDRQGCLATSWEHSADYLEWTYRLRPDVRWHDGRPVTVGDVKFTLDLRARPDSPVYAPGIESVTVHDASTFTVRGMYWSRNSGQDSEVSILPKHLLQHLDYHKFYDWDFWLRLRPVGNGPYRYLRHDPQTMVEVEANPDYYKGKPKIARVVLKFAGQAGLTELLSGNVDAIALNPAQLPSIANDPRFQTYWSRIPWDSWGITWQTEHPLFRDREVRRALSLAINRRELLQVLNLPSQFSRVDGFSTVRQFQRGEQLAEPRYDPAEARRLLDEAGWRQRSRDGMRERDGHDFRFTALTLGEAPGNQAVVYVQDQLRKIGVQMDLQSFERDALVDRLKAGAFEAMVFFDGPSPGVIKRFGFGYRNPRLTRLLEVVGTTADPEVIDDAYREISDIFRTDQPVAFLFRFATPYIVHRRVKGLSAPFRTNPLFFAEDLWLEDER